MNLNRKKNNFCLLKPNFRSDLPFPAAMISGVTLYLVPVQSIKSIWSSITVGKRRTSARLWKGCRWYFCKKVCTKKNNEIQSIKRRLSLRIIVQEFHGQRYSTAAVVAVDHRTDNSFFCLKYWNLKYEKKRSLIKHSINRWMIDFVKYERKKKIIFRLIKKRGKENERNSMFILNA